MPLPDSCILSDDELRALPERYACSARLAEEAGFDGVDIKACHRYLLNELLSAHTRPGPYGGSFENRTRLLRDAVRPLRRPRRAGPLSPAASICMTAFPILTGGGAAGAAASSRSWRSRSAWPRSWCGKRGCRC